MRTLSIDIETYSSADLAKTGVYRYAEAPDFEILLIGYSFDEGPVQVHDCTQPGCWPRDLMDALFDPDVTKYAYNAVFERQAFAHALEEYLPPEQWKDTMIMALECGLPGSLAAAGTALGLPEEQLKDPRGKALIQYFCKPCRPTRVNGGRTRNLPKHDPDKWALFIEYNRQDVVTEMAIRKKLEKIPVPASEWDLWHLDQEMNDRGIRIDLPMVDNIVRYDEQRRAELLEESREITGLSNPNSLAQLKPWIEREGMDVPQLRKDDVEALLKREDLPPEVRRVLEIRQALGKTSTAKYGAMQEAVCEDGRLRGILQFYGANRSGRWAGRIVQVHNLAKNFLPDLDLARELAEEGDFDTMETLFGETAFVFSELIRTAFIPSEGRRFVVSDFSAIEARVVAWLAGEQWTLDAFKAGEDIYCKTASMMYHVPVEKHGQNKHLRQKGKIAVLACGYQGGVGAMKAMDRGGSIPEEELQSVVDQWRAANPNIVKLWYDYEAAAKTAIREGRPVRRGIRIPAENIAEREYMAGGRVREYSVRKGCSVTFTYRNGNLIVILPSGRRLVYWGARLEEDPSKGGRESIVYMGVNQVTKQWGKTETYGGKLVENVVQATARDCLAEAMRRVTAMGYEIVMHIHDEMVVDVPIEDTDALARINKAMGDPIDWASGLPLKGDGYTCNFYMKD
ncbi:MAG: DNA polymerase [Clostridia bacterium]|nr:DNA polymerase [Clostridia bacterium]MBQ8129660.1 DNA polymerase [Clostridia bacterium]